MKVIILAGGFGTRLSEYTDKIPKPMVKIGNKPILWHIMNSYSKHGHKEFFIALGYKSEIIKEYFLNYKTLNSDFTVDLKSGDLTIHNKEDNDWKVTLLDTGLNSMTGGRIKRFEKYIGNEPFLVTYGDGVCDVDLSQLLEFHKKQKKLITVTAVRPSARFGELDIKNNLVESFQEKPQTSDGWINGGYFVCEPEVFDYIDGDSTIFEKDPLEKLAADKELSAYKHYGFWQCMDTKRDRDSLNEMLQNNNAPWTK
jgi:glucose-1-phosphate cytidylyltransferase